MDDHQETGDALCSCLAISPNQRFPRDGDRMTGTETLALVAWWAFIAIGIVCIYLLSTAGDGAVLTIQGSAIGHGLCNLTVEADIISANVSQAVNCSSWQIVAGGI